MVAGEPAQRIIDQGNKGEFDLIAIGTWDHSGSRRGMLDSVTGGVAWFETAHHWQRGRLRHPVRRGAGGHAPPAALQKTLRLEIGIATKCF